MFELRRHGGDGGERANCGDEASGRSNNDRDDGWRWTAPSVTVTAPCEVPSLRAHVEETLLPSVERLGGLGVYTSARSDLLAEEGCDVAVCGRTADDVAAMGHNPMDASRRQAVTETALVTTRRRLADPAIADRLDLFRP